MESKICLGCMREITASQLRCPHCGFSAADPHPSIALPLKSVLNERYVIGKPIRIGGDGISYMAYDLQRECACIIREYLPQQMVKRSSDGVSLEIKSEYLAPFKALLSDFNDLYIHMMSWTTLRHIRRVYDVLATNNTSYAVTEYLEAVTLNRFLEEHGGTLSWEIAKTMFDPLFEELAMIHRSGYLHRAICLENIMVTSTGQLVLISFTICSANVANSEIVPNLSEGYASPEQYVVAQHGEWTDVYGLSAVLYRVLTGIRPQHAQTRQQNDKVIAPNQLNPKIPQYVSNAIMSGLRYEYGERLQNCTILRDALFYGIFETGELPPIAETPLHSPGKTTKVPQDTAMTAYFDAVPEKRLGKSLRDDAEEEEEDEPRYSGNGKRKKNKKKKRPAWKTVVIWSIPIVILMMILLYQIMIGFGKDKIQDPSTGVSTASTTSEVSSQITSQEESVAESKITTYTMVDFVNKVYDDLDLRKYTWLEFENPKFEYSDSYDEGVVMWQSIDAGTEVEEGSTVSLSISSGPRSVTLPDTKDYTAEQYVDLLINKYEIPSVIEKEYSDTVSAGKIIRVEPEAGSVYDRKSQEDVVIFQSIGSDPTILPESDPEAIE